MFRKEPRFACALAALEQGDYAGAEAAFTMFLEGSAGPADRAFLLNKRGVARVGLQRRELARADFDDALRTVENYAPALTNLGNLLLELGELEAAIAHYHRAIAGDDEYALAHLNLSVALKRAGRIGEGVRELRKAHRLEQRDRASVSTFPRLRRR